MKKKITEFIHKETNRSVLQETSLPLYLTSGYVYKNAQESENVFNEKITDCMLLCACTYTQ